MGGFYEWKLFEILMKQLKFRAWDSQTKRFIQDDVDVENRENHDLGNYALDPSGVLYFFQSDEGGMSVLDKKDVEIMQWTGLKDKNGQPVFEGDIVHEDCTNPNVNWTYEVFYDKDEAKFWLRNEEEVYGQWNVYDDPAYVRWSLYEVIGNVWESPELIAK